MSRQKRLYFDNAVYHVCIRGNNKQKILKETDDKNAFLASVRKFKLRFRFKLLAFVIMDNHAHLVIGTDSNINISKIMQAITLSYSRKYRKKYNYTGYVWQGRFKSKIINKDKYILDCIDYIHNNPVRAELVSQIDDYAFSSYHYYSGIENPVNINKYLEIDKIVSV